MKKFAAILFSTLFFIFALCVTGCKTKSGTFYNLKDIYESGELAKDDLLSIAYYMNGGRRGNEELMSEDYAPKAKKPEILSERVDRAIRRTVLTDMGMPEEHYEYEEIDLACMDIIYCGVYNGYIAIHIVARNHIAIPQNYSAKIDDVTFYYTGFEMGEILWKGN